MRRTLFLILLLPVLSNAQKIKTAGYDRFTKKYRIELEPLPIVNTGRDKVSLAFTSVTSDLYLELIGSGWGAFTIDSGSKAIFLFSNDSTAIVQSTGLQTVESGLVQSGYKHQYLIGKNELEAFCSYNLVGIRKYSFQEEFSDLSIPRQNTDAIRNSSLLFRNELKKANLLNDLKNIRQADIKKYTGDSVTFCSKIITARYEITAANKPTLLQLQGSASTPPVNAVIWEEDRKRFAAAPELLYDKKEVCVYGVVQTENGSSQIVIRNKSQLRVTSPVDEQEAALFVGDSITVTGKVVSGIYLPNTKNQPTLLNMGAPYPDQAMTVVIGNAERSRFGEEPENRYQNKRVSVTGKITLYKNKPQITVYRPEQLKVLAEETPAVVAVSATEEKQTDAILVEPPVHREKVYISSYFTETFSAFPGGTTSLISFMKANLQCPENAKSAKTVTASFVIDSDGSIRNIEITDGAGKAYNNEVIRVLQLMPKWTPRVRNGYPVLDKLYETITFACSTEGSR